MVGPRGHRRRCARRGDRTPLWSDLERARAADVHGRASRRVAVLRRGADVRARASSGTRAVRLDGQRADRPGGHAACPRDPPGDARLRRRRRVHRRHRRCRSQPGRRGGPAARTVACRPRRERDHRARRVRDALLRFRRHCAPCLRGPDERRRGARALGARTGSGRGVRRRGDPRKDRALRADRGRLPAPRADLPGPRARRAHRARAPSRAVLRPGDQRRGRARVCNRAGVLRRHRRRRPISSRRRDRTALRDRRARQRPAQPLDQLLHRTRRDACRAPARRRRRRRGHLVARRRDRWGRGRADRAGRGYRHAARGDRHVRVRADSRAARHRADASLKRPTATLFGLMPLNLSLVAAFAVAATRVVWGTGSGEVATQADVAADKVALPGQRLLAGAAFVIGLLGGFLVLASFGFVGVWERGIFGNDFSLIWTGPHLFVMGANPYDPQVWQRQISELGVRATSTSVFIYPGWVPIAIAPFGALPLPIAAPLWLAITLVIAATGLFALGEARFRQLPLAHTLFAFALI